MKINNISNTNFTKLYQTRDILSFVFYPDGKNYDKEHGRELIKFMTGLDPLDKDTFARIYKDYKYNEDRSELAVHDMCSDEIISQNFTLKEADRTANQVFLKANRDEDEIEYWLEKYLDIMGESIDIQPFTVNETRLASKYNLIAGFDED